MGIATMLSWSFCVCICSTLLLCERKESSVSLFYVSQNIIIQYTCINIVTMTKYLWPWPYIGDDPAAAAKAKAKAKGGDQPFSRIPGLRDASKKMAKIVSICQEWMRDIMSPYTLSRICITNLFCNQAHTFYLSRRRTSIWRVLIFKKKKPLILTRLSNGKHKNNLAVLYRILCLLSLNINFYETSKGNVIKPFVSFITYHKQVS